MSRRRNHPGRIEALQRKYPRRELVYRNADEREWKDWCLAWLARITPNGVHEEPPMSAGAARHVAWLDAQPRKHVTRDEVLAALKKATGHRPCADATCCPPKREAPPS